ncbi:DUF6542 domain-containing protein [Streptomyces sp. NPDC050560]|uniref:DUF6542 domain-containing protein n=1 Tax=Streptomyces sp. NPDC050560 TaxID=3365630 RepID=UPI0037B20E8C
MDHPRTRPPQTRPRRTAPLPPQGGPPRPAALPPLPSTTSPRLRRPEAEARPRRPSGPPPGAARPRVSPVAPYVSRVVRALKGAPNPRLTGLGGGLFCAAVMLLVACADRLVLGSSPVVYGVVFLPVAALSALWVRGADLVAAPVTVPIGFAVGVLPICGGTGGFGGEMIGLFTSLALHAGWLYGGTLIAGVIATVRKVRLMRRRFAARAAAPRAPRPRGYAEPALRSAGGGRMG